MKKICLKIFSTQAGITVVLMRIVIGIIFFKAGGGKLFGWFGGPGIEGAMGFFQNLGIPYPKFHVYLVGIVEFAGGLALVAGFLARLVSIPLAITMVVAMLTAHRDMDSHFYYVLVLLMSCLVIIQSGAGCPSVDKFLSECKNCEKIK